jgi:rubrerythrin
MPEQNSSRTAAAPDAAASDQSDQKVVKQAEDKIVCERCGAAMFRMHAVWRCPACGFKTDCCGW